MELKDAVSSSLRPGRLLHFWVEVRLLLHFGKWSCHQRGVGFESGSFEVVASGKVERLPICAQDERVRLGFGLRVSDDLAQEHC